MGYNKKNIEGLARVVVSSWDMKTLVQFAIDKLICSYGADEEAFNQDYKTHKDKLNRG